MTFHQFRDFVAANIDWFRGRLPETEMSLQQAEQALGVELPSSVKWLLKELVLDNSQDGGVILIDTGEETSSGEFAMYWVGMEDLGNPPRLEGNTRYDSFGDYVKDRLPSVQDFIEARYIRYNAADFPAGRGDR